jgi:hypothetical protein
VRPCRRTSGQPLIRNTGKTIESHTSLSYRPTRKNSNICPGKTRTRSGPNHVPTHSRLKPRLRTGTTRCDSFRAQNVALPNTTRERSGWGPAKQPKLAKEKAEYILITAWYINTYLPAVTLGLYVAACAIGRPNSSTCSPVAAAG